MSDAIVSALRLGKRYQISHLQQRPSYVALREVIGERLRHPFSWFRANGSAAEEFWALRNVSFEVAAGEVIGVIGRNGAGKSTLLKVLSRITEPSEGRLVLDGRIASLLEVGTGFHPELSGRENIFLNGAILGMSRAEILRKFDEIVAFAEVEQFLDTPVKRYSSGMYVRLAFAVAAHLEPEILIVDEVLAVGDSEFQKKCLGKMHEVSRGGRTVFFVSHNMAAIQALCSRAIWLDKGAVAFDGPAEACIGRYLSHTVKGAEVTPERSLALGTALVLRSFEVSPNPVRGGERVDFALTFDAASPSRISELALLIYSLQETRVAIVDLRMAGLPVSLAGGQSWSVSGRIDALPLVEGDYRIGIGINSDGYVGDQLGLVDLRVSARQATTGHVPYAAPYRGVVDLQVSLNP
jgi:homopolymeric O-antigen transport system ATP-binding protein